MPRTCLDHGLMRIIRRSKLPSSDPIQAFTSSPGVDTDVVVPPSPTPRSASEELFEQRHASPDKARAIGVSLSTHSSDDDNLPPVTDILRPHQNAKKLAEFKKQVLAQ